MCLLCQFGGGQGRLHTFTTFLTGPSATPAAAPPLQQSPQGQQPQSQASSSALEAFASSAVMKLAQQDRSADEQRALVTTMATLSSVVETAKASANTRM